MCSWKIQYKQGYVWQQWNIYGVKKLVKSWKIKTSCEVFEANCFSFSLDLGFSKLHNSYIFFFSEVISFKKKKFLPILFIQVDEPNSDIVFTFSL